MSQQAHTPLLPCPFCGKKCGGEETTSDGRRNMIRFTCHCGASGPYAYAENRNDRNKAGKLWNTRAESQSLREENRELREALKFYARHEHWMEISPGSLRTSLVAMQGDGEQHGWNVADAALTKGAL